MKIKQDNQTHNGLHQLGEFWVFKNKSVENKLMCLNSKFVFQDRKCVLKKTNLFSYLQIGIKQINVLKQQMHKNKSVKSKKQIDQNKLIG